MIRVYLVPMIEKKEYRKKKKSLLQPKRKRKEIIVYEIFTSIQKLRVPNFVPNYQIFQNND